MDHVFERNLHFSVNWEEFHVQLSHNTVNGSHQIFVYILTCWGHGLLEKEKTWVIRGLPPSLFPSDQKVINKLPFPPICALQEVSHILLNLFSFINGQNVSTRDTKNRHGQLGCVTLKGEWVGQGWELKYRLNIRYNKQFIHPSN